MLRLVGTADIPPAPRIEFDHGFSIWWNEIRDVYPHAWWGIQTEGHYLLVEQHAPSGKLTSIECLSRNTVRVAEGRLWEGLGIAEGHPIFEHSPEPRGMRREPGVNSFVFEYSPTDIKIHWGSEARLLRSGRCMFGWNANDELVSLGLAGMSDAEYGRLRLSLCDSLSGVPVSQLEDWQLAALLGLGREQLDGSWGPGTESWFAALKLHVDDIEREIQRRRGSR